VSKLFGTLLLDLSALQLWPLLGVVTGLYFFFRGFFQLHHKRVARSAAVSEARGCSTKPAPSSAKPDNSLPIAEPQPTTHELVELTAALVAPESSGQMSQQGKIAAALLRAGISTPDIRSLIPPGDSLQVSGGIHGSGRRAGNHPSANASPKAALTLSPAVAPMKEIKKANDPVSSQAGQRTALPMQWEPAMIWGGPALALFSLYLLAAQLGWL
jgi:hypothetical protein